MQLLPSPRIEAMLPPIAWAALAQVLALALTAGVAWFAARAGVVLELPTLLLVQAIMAAALSHALRLPGWWLIIQFCFVPAMVLGSRLAIAPEWYLSGFLLLALLFWSTFRTQVPLYLSRRQVWQALEAVLPQTPGLRFVDLGSGIGGLVAHLARARPDGQFQGIECAPLPSLIGALRMRRLSNARSVRGDIWRQPLGSFDVVFAYLSPVPMPALWDKAKREMRPGTLFISYRFAVPGVAPSDTIVLDDWGRTRLYVWRM